MALGNRIYVFVAFVALLLLCVGCDTGGCHENRSSIASAGLYAYNSPTKAITIDSISLYGIGQHSDSLLLDCARRVSTMNMPFRNDADTTQYVIQYDMKALANTTRYNDTLTWVYKRYPYFVSGDCGVVFNYAIDTVHCTYNMIDSIAVVVDEVTNHSQETIRLYYYVAAE